MTCLGEVANAKQGLWVHLTPVCPSDSCCLTSFAVVGTPQENCLHSTVHSVAHPCSLTSAFLVANTVFTKVTCQAQLRKENFDETENRSYDFGIKVFMLV